MDINQEIINISKKETYLEQKYINYIVNNYKKAEPNESNNWITVCLKGSDYKYGSFKIDPIKKLRRNKTFNEFYPGIVD